MTEHQLHERLARLEAHLVFLVERAKEDRDADRRREDRLRALEVKVWGLLGSVVLLLGGVTVKWLM